MRLNKKIYSLILLGLIVAWPFINYAQTNNESDPANPDPANQNLDRSTTPGQFSDDQRVLDEYQDQSSRLDKGRTAQDDILNPYAITDEQLCEDTGDFNPERPTRGEGDGGAFVPVHEVGQLLTLTNFNSQQIAASRSLNNQICTHLKSIRRIQLAFEYKEFVEDPTLRRQAAVTIADYEQQLVTFIGSGYASTATSSPDGDSPLYVENMDAHLANIRQEVAGVFQEDLKNSGNIFKTEIGSALQNNGSADFQTVIKSDLSKEEYNTFTQNPESLNNQTWWDTWLKVIEPQNNPWGSYLFTASELEGRQARANQNAREEIIAAGGYLPVRTCIEKTADGQFCRTWQVNTIGGTIGRSLDRALDSKLAQHEQSQVFGRLGINNSPNVQEIKTGGRVAGDGSGSPTTPITPGPQPITNQSVDNNHNGTFTDPGDDFDGDGIINSLDLDFIPPIVIPPTVTMSQVITPLSAIAAGAANIASVSWSSQNASRCEANNDWLSKDDNTNSLTVLKKDNNQIAKNGNVEVLLPLSFEATANRKLNGVVASGGTFIDTIDSSNLIQTSIYSPFDAINNNIFTLILGQVNSGLADEVSAARGADNPTDVVNLFNTAINQRPALLRKYRFTFNATTTPGGINNIIIATDPVYKIICYNVAGTATAELRLARPIP